MSVKINRFRVALTSSSVLALMTVPGVAHAACAPDPTVQFGVTTCSGLDPDGIAVNTFLTTVIVEADATVEAGPSPAAIQVGNAITIQVNGVVEGGNRAAIAGPTTNAFPTITNDGRISSTSVDATISSNGLTLTNNKTIENLGSGAAIATLGRATITNSRGATIGTVGGVAITAGSGIILANSGTVTGSIIASGFGPSTLLTSTGTINGDVLLGSTDDTFDGGTYDAELGRFVNVTGVVDGGAGMDTVQMILDRDSTLSSSASLRNFERYVVDFRDVTVNVGADLDLTGGMFVMGTGTLIFDHDATSVGSMLRAIGYPTDIDLTINANLTAEMRPFSGFAIDMTVGDAVNNGTVTSIGGGGIRFSTYSPEYNTFTNNGAVYADSIAVAVDGQLINNGIIRSNANVGVDAIGYYGTSLEGASLNTGIIEGAIAGVRVDGAYFSNSGIVSASDGFGVEFRGSRSRFDNFAGGIVTGSEGGIGFSSSFYGG